jgi:hypothetical protein
VALVAVAVSGCSGQKDGQAFSFVGTLESSTCGGGVVNASDEWSTNIRLRWKDGTLTWWDEDGNELSGSVSSSAATLTQTATYVVTNSSSSAVGCSVTRRDTCNVTLSGAEAAIASATGTVEFRYGEASGYECDALVGTNDGFAVLPCTVIYDFTATPSN